MRIDSRVAVITGASSGIGAELARQLAAAGVRVGLTARRAERLQSLAEAIRQSGGTAAVAPADAADAQATRSAIARLEENLGPIDLLVANAGVGVSTPGWLFKADDFDTMVRVNLVGAAVAFETVLPGMLSRGRGHLVGVSSLAAFRAPPLNCGYASTKAGFSALMEGLRIDLRGRGVAVTAVHPGFVRTPMIEGASNPQPFLMDVGPASRIILKGIAARRREINFPWQATALMRFARALPGPIYDRLIQAAVLGSAKSQ
jgi:short-subunit dehydrogenase